jgi:WD40 repeat protein
MVSTLDGTNRLVLEGDQVGGRPVDGAARADARRLLLLVAVPDAAGTGGASRWRVVDVDATDGSTRDTGIAGSASVPVEGLRADFADHSDSVVVWGDSEAPTATLVQLTDGSQAAISTPPRPADVIGFRATPTGAAELWADGTVTLVDRAGTTIQELHAHQGAVADIAVSPDGKWAASAGAKGQLLRWDVDPATGQWSDPTPLAGHSGNVVGVEVDPTGDRLASVASDHTIISWDMRRDGGRVTPDDSERLDAACTIVARDFTPTEWRRFLPDRRWQPTCSDLL